MRILPFALVALSVLLLGHYYLWTRLVRGPEWPPAVRLALTVMLGLLFLSVPAALIGGRGIRHEGLSRALAAVAFTWLGFAFLLLVLLSFLDLAHSLFRIWAHFAHAAPPADPERRRLLARTVAQAASVGAALVGGVAVRSALAGPELREVRVRLARLPAALQGMSIVQLSDVHIGPTIGRAFIEELVERVNALGPDLIAITGDLVDAAVDRLADDVEPLRRLSARFGVFFVTGNHEYYAGAVAWAAALQRLGIRVLANERVRIGEGSACMELAGVNDPSGGMLGPAHAPNLERALAGRDEERPLILLAHRPHQVEQAAAAGVALQLSGHTHGGQIWPFGGLTRLVEPYLSGLHRHGPKTQIYVSRGTGYWGPPMRLFSPAEITRVRLFAE